MENPGRFRLKLGPWELYVPFLLYLLHALLFRAWLIDDAGISLVYSRNLIQGYGLVTQPGSPPVEGFSNPLWVFLLSPFFLIDWANPTLIVKLASYACVLATFWIVRRTLFEFLEERWWSRVATFGALSYLAMSTSFVVWSVSGLENPLYATCLALYAYFCMRIFVGTPKYHGGIKLPMAAGLAAAGLALTRPDGVFFLVCFPALAVLALFLRSYSFKGASLSIASFLVAAAVPIGGYIAFRKSYFGEFLPNTYYVKGGPTAMDVLDIAGLSLHCMERTYEILSAMHGYGAGWAALIFLLALGLVVSRSARPMGVLTLAIFVFSGWAVYLLLPEDWMGEFRFATPLFVAWGIAIFALTAALAESRAQQTPRTAKAVFLVFLTLVLVNAAFVAYPRSKKFAADPTVPFSRVALQAGRASDVYAQYLGLPGATYLCPDVGGAYYYSPLRVYDLVGLCDAQIAKIRQGKNSTKMRDHIFNNLKPTFIMVHSQWAVNLAIHGDERLKGDYETIWETPFTYFFMQRQFKSTSGAYVRKDAISNPEKLEQLKQFIAENEIAPLQFDAATEAYKSALSESPEGWKGEGTGRLLPFPHPSDAR